MRSSPTRTSALANDRGSVTAEFAVVLPAVLVVLMLAVGAVMLATHRLTLTSAAAEVARHEARGDSSTAAQRLGALSGSVSVERRAQGGLHCVTLRSSPAAGLLRAVEVSGRGCAARTLAYASSGSAP